MSRRELIVYGPGSDPRVVEQISCVNADPAGAEERELVVVHREAPRFQVELLGKDGGVKARWEDSVGCEELWARIDAMPSRRRAMLRRRAADSDGQVTRSARV
jgi:hypothetical protein